ncbi:MAG: cysteine desulfurase family protein [Thermoflexaceae bacterium]|nr:cysteine desulfurase family protein [Thermoflexaceae bacterium]
MQAYFDNSATTRCIPAVREAMDRIYDEDYGNPSSLHMMGVNAEKHVKNVREVLARILKVNEKEIVFTSGGTESNNMAIIGCAMANKRSGNHIITSSIEHAAVLEPMKFLEEQGFSVTYLPVDEKGRVDLAALKEAVREDTILVSVMCVNNEIGTIEPMEEIAGIVKQKNPKAYFHVDAIQGFGKLKLYPKRMGIDMLSVSGHKINGPKGVGFLYIDEKVKIKPIILGGGQQKGMRSGTDNVPGVVGLAKAAGIAYDNFEEKQNHLYELRRHMIDGLKNFDCVTINGIEETGADTGAAPHIISVSFAGVRSEVLLHALEDKEIYVSAGSACSSNKPSLSKTLLATGTPKDVIESTVRISFGTSNTLEEVEYCLSVLRDLIPVLQKYVRK